MKNRKKSKKINSSVIKCWLVLAITILAAYFVNCLNNGLGIQYIIIYFIISFLPIIGVTILNNYSLINEKNIKYYIATSYVLFYTYVLTTSADNISFIYIIPMIATLVVYTDKLLIGIMCFYAVFINFAYIITSYALGNTSAEFLNIYYVQITSCLLSGLFLYAATDLLKKHDERLHELRNVALKDALTGAFNRKFVDDLFATTKEENIAFALIDIDDFKKFNTDYGHDFGDIVLKSFSAIVIEIISSYDKIYFARLGGDEFAIIALNVNYDKFIKLIDGIRMTIDSYKIKREDENVGISISIGSTNSKVARSRKFEILYKKADVNLYKAKDAGKNIVMK